MKSAFLNTVTLAIAQVVAALGALAATLVFARILGPEGFGQAMAAISILLLVSLLLSLNIESVAPRFLLQGKAQDRAGYLRQSRVLVLWGSAAWAFAVLALALITNRFEGIEIALAILVPMLAALSRLTAKQGASLQKIRAATLPRLLIRPIVFSAAALACLALDIALTPIAIVSLFLFAASLTLIIQLVLLRRTFQNLAGPYSIANSSIWIRQGAMLAPSVLFLEMFRDLVLAAAAIGLSKPDLGVLAAALSLIALPGFVLIAAEIAFTPKIARAIATNNLPERDTLLRLSALARISGVLVCSAILLTFRFEIASLLGADYFAAASLLPILLLIPLSRMLVGNPVMLLGVTGKAAGVFKYAGTGAVLTFVTIALFAGTRSIVDVAMSVSLCYALMQGALALQCFRRTGINPTGLSWPKGRKASLAPYPADTQILTAQKAENTV